MKNDPPLEPLWRLVRCGVPIFDFRVSGSGLRVYTRHPYRGTSLIRSLEPLQVDRQKSKKTTTYSFELIRMKEKDIPIEVLECPDQVMSPRMP